MLQNQPHTVLVNLAELLDLAKNEELGWNRNSAPHPFFEECTMPLWCLQLALTTWTSIYS